MTSLFIKHSPSAGTVFAHLSYLIQFLKLPFHLPIVPILQIRKLSLDN